MKALIFASRTLSASLATNNCRKASYLCSKIMVHLENKMNLSYGYFTACCGEFSLRSVTSQRLKQTSSKRSNLSCHWTSLNDDSHSHSPWLSIHLTEWKKQHRNLKIFFDRLHHISGPLLTVLNSVEKFSVDWTVWVEVWSEQLGYHSRNSIFNLTITSQREAVVTHHCLPNSCEFK
jgi:hypothetical protein